MVVIRSLKEVPVCPIYCIPHTLHSTKWITLKVSHVKFPRILYSDLELAVFVCCIVLQIRHRDFGHGRHSWWGYNEHVLEFTSASLRFRDCRAFWGVRFLQECCSAAWRCSLRSESWHYTLSVGLFVGGHIVGDSSQLGPRIWVLWLFFYGVTGYTCWVPLLLQHDF